MKLSFVWHMHQPDYRNQNGIMQMPWVFLHAIKDYYDMPWYLSLYSNIKATFNITPTLISQLKLYYNEPLKYDKFLSLWIKEPSKLSENEKEWLIKICKTSQYETMVKNFPQYKILYKKDDFSNNELIDLELLFILSWCGIYLKRNNNTIQKLINKGKDYTQNDKILLLNTLSSFISKIFDFYIKLYNDKKISLSTTPFFHPILPLLIDMQSAKSANPNIDIPKNYFSLLDDAKEHIKRAKELFKDTFSFEVNGFWPAEGAVDEKSVELLKSFDINWIATDEIILYKSINSNNKSNIYSLYNYNGIFIAFRDHYLSDLIGFQYRYKDANAASDDFILNLKDIENNNSNSVVFVILDGENAWEFYKNNAFDFFNALYGKINNLSFCQTITMDEAIKLPFKNLTNISAGSWIDGKFDTWVGNAQKTKAWELLFQTKKDYLLHKNSLDKDTQNIIEDIFLKAESSDWFWWYGDDHYSDFGNKFDTLFRNNLIDIYNLMNIEAPNELFIPINSNQSFNNFWIKEQSKISPTIDGKKDSFFEWLGAGVINENKSFSTMDTKRGAIHKIYYGQDDKNLYFLFEGDISKLCNSTKLLIHIEPIKSKITIDFSKNIKESEVDGIKIKSACKDILEFSIEKKNIKSQKIYIRFELIKDKKSIEILPSFGELEIDLNDDFSQNWFA